MARGLALVGRNIFDKPLYKVKTSINWEAVKAYYLKTRSYKLTAEKFSLTVAVIKARRYREAWVEVSQNATTITPLELQNATPVTPAELQSVTPITPAELQNATSATPVELQDATPSPCRSTLPLFEIPASFPELPCLPNLTAREVVKRRPWDVAVVDHGELADKAAYRAYITNSRTQDCLFCGILGEAPNLRVGRDNPPAWMLAVVADYDTPMSSDKVNKMLTKLHVRPNFISTSYSGGTHAVWVLERPIPLMPDIEAQDRLLGIIRKELKLNTAFGPIDTNAFCNLGQYYHAGWGWMLANEEPVPASRSSLWLCETVRKTSHGVPAVPVSAVASEVEKRFPGRWQGDFVVGARGVRFWDALADNDTAAVVTENGMVCFTGPVPFQSWEDIFGSGFTERYKADTLGRVLAECYFVNNAFYTKMPYAHVETWQALNRQSMESLLSSRYGLRNRAARDEDQSEVKQAISTIIDMNTLAAARPFLYRRETVITFDGMPTLNTSLLRVYPPESSKGQSWGDGFPWIAAFLETLFPDCVERERFISEWAYAYKHAYAGNPRNGHVVFIAGDVGVGKNFLTECLIGVSLGGFADPSDYLLGRTRFTDCLFQVGVWLCNDTVSRGDDKERRIFTSNLKRMAANSRHMWEGKFRGATNIEWQGRVYVTLNTDPVSLQLLPDLDQSNRDKISLYKACGKPLDDPQALHKSKREMGALCAYLLQMEYPEHCRDSERWGVRNYLNPELQAEADSSGTTASFGEILSQFCKDMFEGDSQLQTLEGSSTWFLQRMLEQSSLKEMLRDCISPRMFGKRMSALVASETFPLTFRRTNTERLWLVERTAFENYLQHGNLEGGLDEKYPF